MNRIGRGLQQLITDKDSAKGRALQQRIDADAPMQEGVNGVSGFIGRVLPYAATAVMGGPEAAVLGRLGQAGTLARFATKAGVAAAEGAGYGALGETRTGENRLANAGYGALGGVAARGALGAARGVTSGLARHGDPLLQADITIAQREGIPLHVSQVAQSTPARTMASMAKYLPFSGADAAARNQQNAWNRALTRHVGDATDRLDDSWIAKQKQALGEAYDTIWNRNDVTISLKQPHECIRLCRTPIAILAPMAARWLKTSSGAFWMTLRRQDRRVRSAAGTTSVWRVLWPRCSLEHRSATM